MKKLSILIVMLLNASLAQATSLTVSSPSAVFGFSGYDAQPATVTGTKSYGTTGTLVAQTAGIIKFTYLGQESGYFDSFKFNVGGLSLLESDPLGKTISLAINPGAVGFSFMDDVDRNGTVDHTFANGSTTTGRFGYAFLMDRARVNGQNDYSYAHNANISAGLNKGSYTFDYLLGFNDSYAKPYSRLGDSDWDDFVVGVKFTPSPVPLPAAGWLFISALFGFISLSNRRKV